LTNPDTGRTLRVIASDGRDWADEKLPGEPWEHVSASTSSGMLPRWGEMQWLKTVFWDADETVIQIHPPDSDYVNVNEVLHLWKPPGPVIPAAQGVRLGRNYALEGKEGSPSDRTTHRLTGEVR
jgi:hypothetical protein